MAPASRRIGLAATAALLLGLTFLTIAPNLTSPMPDRDSGVFLYIGSQILRGDVPYRDVWDHKGPLMYFFNAVAVALDPGGEFGLWAMELAMLLLAGGLLLTTARTVLGPYAAATVLIGFYVGVILTLRPGNYTEEFALPLVVLSLYVLQRERKHGQTGATIALGTCLVGTLLLRPNLGGIPMLCGMAILVSRSRTSGRRGIVAAAAGIGTGAAIVAAPILLYLSVRGALGDAWDQYILYNLIYATSGTTSGALVVAEGLTTLLPPGLSLVGLAGAMLIGVDSVRRRPVPTVLLVAAVDLPLEIGLTSLGGRGITHYYLSWVPSLALLSGWAIERLVTRMPVRALVHRPFGKGLIALAFPLLALGVIARRGLPSVVRLLVEGPRSGNHLAAAIPGEVDSPLLMWGAETAYHYFSGRPAASRYVYQYPLYVCGYATPERIADFGRQVLETRPWIVDTSSTNARVPPLDPSARAGVPELSEECALSPELVTLMDALWGEYQVVGQLAETGWTVLAPAGGGQDPPG